MSQIHNLVRYINARFDFSNETIIRIEEHVSNKGNELFQQPRIGIMQTQEILQKLYDAVLNKIESFFLSFAEFGQEETEALNQIASFLNLESENINDDEEDIYAVRTALYPVVQYSVVQVMQALVEKSSSDQEFSNQHLEYIIDEILDMENYPAEIGLTIDDSMMVVSAVKETFKETSLFNRPCRLEMDGTGYSFLRQQSKLCIIKEGLELPQVQIINHGFDRFT